MLLDALRMSGQVNQRYGVILDLTLSLFTYYWPVEVVLHIALFKIAALAALFNSLRTSAFTIVQPIQLKNVFN